MPGYAKRNCAPDKTAHFSGGPSAGLLLRCISLLGVATLAACGTSLHLATQKATDAALGTIGLKLANKGDGESAPKILTLHLEGAKDLNATEDGQGLATVIRLYRLRDYNNFLSMPRAGFGSPAMEKQLLGSDLLDARELILSPGQTLDLQERMAGEAVFLGVVALFREPAPHRWRYVFAAENTRITMGVHACAMSVTDLAPIGMSLRDSARVSSVQCQSRNTSIHLLKT